MLRRLLLSLPALALVCAAAATAASLPGLPPATAPAGAVPTTVLPGVTYERQTTLTAHGPVAMHVVTGAAAGGLLTLEPVLSNDLVPGNEPLTAIERRLAATATTIGVNGDVGTKDGRPLGLVLRAGALQHGPLSTRSSVGVNAAGALRAARVQLLGTWQGAGQRRSLSLVNESPTGNQVALFTPAWGPVTPQASGTVEITLEPFPNAAPGAELVGSVVRIGQGGGTQIPPDGAVLVGRGSSATNMTADITANGQPVKVRLVLKPDWSDVVDGIGGGPQLVRGGVAVYRPVEGFARADLLVRGPRTAVGQRADGSLLLVVVDGGRPGYSVGMTSFELAQAMVRLGAVVASALGTGAESGLAFGGTMLSRPAGAEVPIADALLLVYRGVYVPVVAPVLSPNGDGVNDSMALSYKTVRDSQVTATLLGPDGQPRLSDQGARPAQVYPFAWSGLTAAGTPDVEGTYRWTVSATDDLGRQSSMERTFVLNRTLGALRATASLKVPSTLPQAIAAYTLTRTSKVTVAFLSPAGVVAATLPAQTLEPGQQVVNWDGSDTNGSAVAPGRYTIRVTADNEVGSVAATAPVVVRGA